MFLDITGRQLGMQVSSLLGTTVNALAIIAGALAGRYLIPSIPRRMGETVTAGVALAVVLIGLRMAFESEEVLVVILGLAAGGAVGEALRLHDRLEWVGDRLKSAVGGESRVGEAFVAATLIFCVGPMAIMGAIQSGVQGDHSTLFAKSMLDGITSIVLASTIGVGAALSAVPVFLYQGAITLAGVQVAAVLSPGMVLALTGTGGLMIVGLGINMLGLADLRVANFLPALLIAPILTRLASVVWGLGIW